MRLSWINHLKRRYCLDQGKSNCYGIAIIIANIAGSGVSQTFLFKWKA